MAEQTSRLVIEISSEQAKKNAEDLSKELVKIFTGGEKASDSTSKLGKTIQVTSNITQNFNTTVNNTTKAVEKQTQELAKQEKQVNQNIVAVKELAKFIAGYISISKGIALADGYTQMAARIRNATTSAQEYNLVQERLLVTANTTFRALSEAQEVYLSLSGGMKSLGYNTKQTLDLSDSLSFAFTANATRADQAQSAMDALAKSMAKGKIDADAWISIVTGADNIIADMAKTTGKTEAEIRQLGASGKASLEDLIRTLVATREQNEALANNMENSFKDGLTKLINETTVFLGKLNETTKLTGNLAAGLGFLGEHVDKIAVLGGVAASIYGGRLVAAFTATAVKAGWTTAAIIAEKTATVELAGVEALRARQNASLAAQELRMAQLALVNAKNKDAQALATQRLAAAEIAYAASVKESTIATAQYTLAQDALNKAQSLGSKLLTLVGGPIGALTLGVTALAAGYSYLTSESDTATNSLDIQKQTVKELAEEYSKMSMNKLISEIDVLHDKAQKAKNESNDALNKAYSVAPVVGDFGTEKQREQNKLLTDTIDKLKAGSIDAAKALGELRKGGFSDKQIETARRAFAAYEDNDSVLRLVNSQISLATSYLDKASGAYETTTDKIADLTKQSNYLNESYTKSKTDINTVAQSLLQVGENSGASAQQLKIANNALDSYSKGSITATQLAQIFQKNLPIPQESINSFIAQSKQSDAYKTTMVGVNAELKKQNDFRDAYLKQHQGILTAEQKETEEKNKQVTAQEKLNKLQETYAQKNLDTDFELINIKSHGLDMGKALAEFYEANKISKTRSLTNDEWAVFQKYFNKIQERKKLEDDITESKRSQTKEAEKQQKLAEKQLVALAGNNEQTRNMLRVYQAFRNTGLGDKQARVMTAQVGRENDFRSSAMFGSHGDFNNGYTNTGFISWQKGRSANLMKFLQGQGVLDKNGKIQQNQDALDAMAKFLMQEVASTNGYKASKNALANDSLSYRELEKIIGQNLIGWDYNGNGKLGKTNASKHLAKQDGYYNQLSKLLGSDPENALSSTKMWAKFEDEAYKARAKTEEEIKQLQAKYDTEAIQRSKARDEEISKATILGQTQLIPKIKERYDAQDKLAQLQIDSDLNGWKWNENQKLVYTYQTNKLRLDAEGKLGEDIKDLAKKNLDEQMLYETQKRLQASSLGIGQIQLDAHSYLRQKQDPNGFQQDQLDSETIKKYRELQLQYSSQRGDIFTLVNDENVRNQQLLDAHKQFLEAKKALDDEYFLKQQDLAVTFQNDQFGMYNQLLSQAGSVWGSMTQMIKDSAGESSAAYKAMFLAQQAIAIGQAIINTEVGATAALKTDPTGFMSMMTRGLGYASVGLIASQTIQGMAHNGIDNIPREGTWLLDGGERVLNPKQNQDLTNYLSSRRERQQFEAINEVKSNSDVISAPVTVYVTIQRDGSSEVKSEGASKELGNIIGNGIRKIIQQECNQGGIIDKEFRKRR